MPLLPEDDLWTTAKTTVRNLAAGAVKATKSAAGIDQADAATIAARLAICRACPELVMDGTTERCGPLWRSLTGKTQGKTCGCGIASKTKLRSEKCPMGKW